MAEMLPMAWNQYRSKVYPEGIEAVQEAECRQAFFAGALIGINILFATSKELETEFQAEFERRQKEFNSAASPGKAER